MADIIRLKKGLDIPMFGSLTDNIVFDTGTRQCAVVPDDFPGMVWKLRVAVGDSVLPGDTLLSDKTDPTVCLVSPVAGRVSEVRRGERRKILAVVVECSVLKQEGLITELPAKPIVNAQGEPTDETLKPDFSTPDATLRILCYSGLWAMLRQRPYDIVPRPAADFRDVFVTAFDSAPLAPSVIGAEDRDDLEAGLEVLSSLTTGKVYLSTQYGAGITSAVAEVHEFDGPHPAGNVGVQIARLNPVNKGERVLTLDARTAARIGHLKRTGRLDFATRVAVTGPEVETPQTVVTAIGASIQSLIDGNLKSSAEGLRVISGNVLTGVKVNPKDGFLRFPYRQITVIEEGDHADEFMGWATLSPKKFSVKRTFPAFLGGLKRPFNFDARIRGGHRAMILSGEYDKVFPFDIYPEYLLKAIMNKDIDKMEQLGIYEVAPEDFALPEFVDTSKLPLQKIVREGLDYLRAETE